eukprot:CAMPEP_0194284734 /NCGR_PEP_ID=MMETSP0169-20130528/28428_1 /TAXON_ID=218684 /ORGANISM="Corethron pennatum, Strain L29A3" /LENGTH=429 /DNA_ID=CAMNT_0039030641 /DNA_START=137 /DNA_END=1426 /DNA_ORIENTATION=-
MIDLELLWNIYANIRSWWRGPSSLRVPPVRIPNGAHAAVFVDAPGGPEVLSLRPLSVGDGASPPATGGYNLLASPCSADIPPECLLVRVSYFSVNYADVCVRWGLYESAKKYVGYPIVPGFDVAGVVEQVGADVAGISAGDEVFGVTLFGGYSTRVLVPAAQMRPRLPGWTAAECASLPAVSLTALHALSLGGAWPAASPPAAGAAPPGRDRSVLVHSAAGGVGSMLVQMSAALDLGPVVGVVGRPDKVAAAREAGCDAVIDKSGLTPSELWEATARVAPSSAGYKTVMDANGVSTLRGSYDALAPTGRLVVYGFHTNLPRGAGWLSPAEWVRMAWRMWATPAFDPMDLTVSNRSVMGFNLSFLADEVEAVSALFDQVVRWAREGKIRPPAITLMDMADVGAAHELIQSGRSVGKIVLRTPFADQEVVR